MASFSATQLACASFSLCVSSCFVFGGRTGGGEGNGRKWLCSSLPLLLMFLSTKRIFYSRSVLSTNGCVSSQ